MSNLLAITGITKEVLEQYEQTRNSDSLLYLKVLERYSHERGIDLRLLSVPVFLKQMGEMGLPKFESVRRARQKLQATYPHLAADKAVEGFRMENEKTYREFARGEV